MIWIQHRVNTVAGLKNLNLSYGAEIDIRSNASIRGEMHLSHDPGQVGENFDLWLEQYKTRAITGPLILNTKEDGLETWLSDAMTRAGIKDWFFLDTAFPTLIKKTLIEGSRSYALRMSRYEELKADHPLWGKVDWVWVDCFDGEPIDAEPLSLLKGVFKICLVSPELQGVSTEQLPSAIQKFEKLLPFADAICTKVPHMWQKIHSLD